MKCCCKTCLSDWRYFAFLQMLVALKEPVMMCGNLNVKQATSQQVFKLTTFCMDTHFQSFSPLINRIVHHVLLKFSPSQQAASATLPYRGLVLDTHAPVSCPRCDNLPDLDKVCWLATCQDRLMNWGVSRRRSSTVSRAWWADALFCWDNANNKNNKVRATVKWFYIVTI